MKWDALQEDLKNPQNMIQKGRLYTAKHLNKLIDILPKHPALESVRGNWTKVQKINAIALAVGAHQVAVTPVMRKKSPNSLRLLAKGSLGNRKYPKDVLNIILAQYNFPARYKSWKNEQVINEATEIEGIPKFDFWYSYVEYNKDRKQIEPKNIDPSHLLTNGRVKITKDGAHGVSKESFLKAIYFHFLTAEYFVYMMSL